MIPPNKSNRAKHTSEVAVRRFDRSFGQRISSHVITFAQQQECKKKCIGLGSRCFPIESAYSWSRTSPRNSKRFFLQIMTEGEGHMEHGTATRSMAASCRWQAVRQVNYDKLSSELRWRQSGSDVAARANEPCSGILRGPFGPSRQCGTFGRSPLGGSTSAAGLRAAAGRRILTVLCKLQASSEPPIEKLQASKKESKVPGKDCSCATSGGHPPTCHLVTSAQD
jgi:hypothetical protein